MKRPDHMEQIIGQGSRVMPELNGIEAMRIIRDDMPETKVLIPSIDDGHELVHRSLEAGASSYLLKESAGKNLFEATRRIKYRN